METSLILLTRCMQITCLRKIHRVRQIFELLIELLHSKFQILNFYLGTKLQLSSSYPGGIRYFLTYFKKISEFFSKSLKQILKISKSEYARLYVYKQVTFKSNFSSLALAQTDLGKFLTFFQESFRIFQQKS